MQKKQSTVAWAPSQAPTASSRRLPSGNLGPGCRSGPQSAGSGRQNIRSDRRGARPCRSAPRRRPFRVLPPGALDLRIPARQLRPEIDDLAEPAFVDQLLDLHVGPVELHHVAFLEEHAPAAAERPPLAGPARRLSVSGFSQRTCLPASAASSICLAWQRPARRCRPPRPAGSASRSASRR